MLQVSDLGSALRPLVLGTTWVLWVPSPGSHFFGMPFVLLKIYESELKQKDVIIHTKSHFSSVLRSNLSDIKNWVCKSSKKLRSWKTLTNFN